MAASKYLRFISVEPDAAMEAVRSAPVHHISALLEQLFRPISSKGIAKATVSFSPEDSAPTIEETLDVATIRWPFKSNRFLKLSPDEQRAYYLQQLGDAIRFAAPHYGWDTAQLDTCCAQITKNAFKAEWWWPAKPKLNSNRQISAQAFVELSTVTRAWLVFRRRSGEELRRVLFTDLGPGGTIGALKYVLGDLSWHNDETARVCHTNKRDYWLISPDGNIEFIFLPAESRHAQGLFQLGQLYWEGRYVLKDHSRALKLMRHAAALGDKHAQRFIGAPPSLT